MARLYEKQPTVTAGTAKSSPQQFSWPMEDAYLVSIEIVAPPGPSGLVGIRLSRVGTPIIPYNSDTWLVMDNEKLPVTFEQEITKSGLTVEMYNSDIYDHTFYLRAIVIDSPQQQQQVQQIALTSADVLSTNTQIPAPG